jgi:hypothetical protein
MDPGFPSVSYSLLEPLREENWAMMVFRPMASRYRYRKIVKCPEIAGPAEILINASPASSSKGKRSAVRNYSLWPKRKGCTQSCLK